MSESVTEALCWAVETGRVQWPPGTRACVLEATPEPAMRLAQLGADVRCVQPQAGVCDALTQAGFTPHAIAPVLAWAQWVVMPATRVRALNRSLMGQACLAAPDAHFLMAAPNAEGAKSTESDLAELLPRLSREVKHKCRIAWGPMVEANLAQATQWATAAAPRQRNDGLWTQAGVFSADATDPASALLCAHLPPTLGGRVADFGAGIGVLARYIAGHGSALQQLDLYESDARALDMARLNLATATMPLGFHWQDLTQGIDARDYDCVVMNPPFHAQSRAGIPQLGRRFVEVAASALKPDGELWLVANSHLPYEEVLMQRFANVVRVVQQGGFKVIHATQSKRAA